MLLRVTYRAPKCWLCAPSNTNGLMIDVQSVMIQATGVVALLVNVLLMAGGMIAIVRFFCQKMSHRLNAKDRFSASWTEEARKHPDHVAEDADSALDWLESTVAEHVAKLTKVELIRAGHDDPEKFERMSDIWRFHLERGQMAGTILPGGDGYATHVHVIPGEAPGDRSRRG